MTSSNEETLLTGYSGRLLLAVSVGWFAVQGGRLVVSPLLPAIQTDLGIGSTRAGIALSSLWGLYALLQYPSGRLSDTLSRKTLLVAGLLAVSVGFLSLSAAPTYLAFLGGALLVGFGAGLYPTPARGLLSDLFVRRRGQAFGIHTAAGDLGGVAAAGLATAVLAIATWRVGFLPAVAVLLAVALALHVWSRESYVLARPRLAAGDTARRLFATGRTRWLLIAYTAFAFTWQATTGFLPTYLQVGKSFTPAVANVAFGALFVVGTVVKPVAGGLGDRLPKGLLAVTFVTLAALALGGVVLATTPLMATISVAVFAAGLMAYPPVMQAYLMDTFPDDSAAGDLGAMRTVYIGIGALGPTYVGIVADVLSYDVAFAGLVGALVFSATLILVTTRNPTVGND
ncbi:MAG: MFS transporter [Halanaeroarchaeum sp.]